MEARTPIISTCGLQTDDGTPPPPPPPPLTCSGVGVVVPGLLCDVEDLGNHVLHPPWHAATGGGGGGGGTREGDGEEKIEGGRKVKD